MITIDDNYLLKIHANKISLFKDLFNIVQYTDYKGKIPRIGYVVRKKYTAINDLLLSENDILMNIKTTCRNEIRRAEKEGVQIEISRHTDKHDPEFEKYIEYYNHFAIQKNLPQLNISNINKYPVIIIGKAIRGDEILSMHATFIDEEIKIASLLFSCSIRLNENIDHRLIGWSNRLLHFKEFLYFKTNGIKEYDWSGIGNNPNPEGSIAKFKLSFGGTITPVVHLQSYSFFMVYKIKQILKSM